MFNRKQHQEEQKTKSEILKILTQVISVKNLRQRFPVSGFRLFVQEKRYHIMD